MLTLTASRAHGAGGASRSEDPLFLMRLLHAAPGPSELGVWRSLVARLVRDEEVVGSNPATPTR